VKHLYLGIDLGGSNITAALMKRSGEVLAMNKVKTLAHEGHGKITKRLIENAKALFADEPSLHRKNLKAVGIGVPGVIDIKRGVVRYSPNLPGWTNIHLREKIRKAFRVPVYMDNDANVAAFGEKWLGAGKGFRHVVVYTLGTGVGGGVILNGGIFHGSCDGAGELGHTTIIPDGPLCNCGNRGCLEALVSGTAIAREGRQAAGKDKRSLMNKLAEGESGKITSKIVFHAAEQGDKTALRVVSQVGKYLGIGVANVINLLNPQLIIIGGGVSKAGDALLKYVKAEAQKRAMKELYRCTKIVKAQLADRAGVFGAAGIAIHVK